MLLHKAQHRVDDQQSAHHREIREFGEHRRQHHDLLKHPRRQAPELAKKHEGRVFLLFGHFVEAMCFPARIDVSACETRFGAHV